MRYLTAGESHGKALTAIIEGFPANLKINISDINFELKRRQSGYGRGARMKIESDKAEITAGVRGGLTLGSPICLVIQNADYKNWTAYMDAETGDLSQKRLTAVRPGHADLSGCVKFNQTDARNILERSSARQTAIRTAVGALCKQFLHALGITIASYVHNIGGEIDGKQYGFEQILQADGGDNGGGDAGTRCLSAAVAKRQREAIDRAAAAGDTVGGAFTVVVRGLKIGVGSHTEWDLKLDAELSRALMSLQGVKAVEAGIGAAAANVLGSAAHDRVYLAKNSDKNARFFCRKTNNAGGVEGGISNGEDIVLRVTVKPIPTLRNGLSTVDIATLKPATAAAERSDICAVPAASVIAENIAAFTVADMILKKTGGDHMEEILERWKGLI
jgi:chorismate synthase